MTQTVKTVKFLQKFVSNAIMDILLTRGCANFAKIKAVRVAIWANVQNVHQVTL